MKTRVALIVLALVVLPTAVLSVLASRALKSRELVLQAQLEIRASRAIEMVAENVSAVLDDNLEKIRLDVSESVSRGGNYYDVGRVADRICKSVPLVEEVYLFLYPWGFMYPQLEQDEARGKDTSPGKRLRPGWDYFPTAGWKEKDEGLVQSTKREIESSSRKKHYFKYNNAPYCFSKLSSSQTLFAGFRVDGREFNKQLLDVVSSFNGEGFKLVMEMPSVSDDLIVVSDSFSSVDDELDRAGSMNLQLLSDAPLAIGRLAAPFDHMAVYAVSEDSEALADAAKMQKRLFAWSIILMVSGVCVGVWLLIRESAREIEMARARADFVVGVSHDLRTPISSMKMLAESLYLDHVKDAAKKKKFLETIARESDRLADMVERVLFFVREEHGASIYRFEQSNAESLVRDVVESFESRKHGSVKVDLAVAGNLAEVNIDKEAITKVVTNLLDNAEKYTAETGQKEQKVHIKVCVDETEARGRRWVRIAVSDHGIGIEKKELKKVFRKFYRADIEKDGKVGGIGLGLSLCKSIANAHSGRMTVDSVEGKGSTFTLWLPV